MKRILLLVAACFSIPLSGCVTTGGTIGGVIGGGLANAAAHRESAAVRALITALGVWGGAVVGDKIGDLVTENDRRKTQQVLSNAANGQTGSWSSETGVQYSVTPQTTARKNARECREFVTKATIDGKSDSVRGTACRDSLGNWRIEE